jgi:pyruvate-ferredoxin/flavodoxin oxidoreductase
MMDRFARRTGRQYHLFDYHGHPQAERVIVLLGSAVDTFCETIDDLTSRGEKVGVVSVRLYRPFSVKDFVATLPASTKAIAALDRTKEPGAIGEPLYLDVIAALREAREQGISPVLQEPVVVGGRYGLSSKEFTPPMVKAVFDELRKPRPKNHFTIGIVDDVTHTSCPTTPIGTSSPTMSFEPSFSASGPTGPWGPTRIRSRSSAKRLPTSRRDTSCTTRRSRDR